MKAKWEQKISIFHIKKAQKIILKEEFKELFMRKGESKRIFEMEFLALVDKPKGMFMAV
jgi:hypothetical protein